MWSECALPLSNRAVWYPLRGYDATSKKCTGWGFAFSATMLTVSLVFIFLPVISSFILWVVHFKIFMVDECSRIGINIHTLRTSCSRLKREIFVDQINQVFRVGVSRSGLLIWTWQRSAWEVSGNSWANLSLRLDCEIFERSLDCEISSDWKVFSSEMYMFVLFLSLSHVLPHTLEKIRALLRCLGRTINFAFGHCKQQNCANIIKSPQLFGSGSSLWDCGKTSNPPHNILIRKPHLILADRCSHL